MTLVGTVRLVAFTIRRDRLRIAVWAVAVIALMVVSAASLVGLYPDTDAIVGYTTLFDGNPALVVFAGPGYGFDNPNLGVILVNETQLWGSIALALMAIFMVCRSTRADEDAERTDLIRSLPVGRHAPLTAALVVVIAANVAIGAAIASGFVALGYPTVGSVALAASMAAVGIVFAGVTAVAAQVAGSARACLGLASLALAAAFALRALGDVADSPISLLSPLGMAQAVRAFADEQWWVLAVLLAAAVGLTTLSFALANRRNLGSGMVAERPGRRQSPMLAARPLLLPMRLQRGSLVGWLVGLATIGAVYGSFADSVDQMVADTPALADFFAAAGGPNLTDAYLNTAMVMLALITGGLAISSTLTANAEERAGRTDLIVARPMARSRWFASHLAAAVIQTAAVMLVAGVAVGAAYGATIGDPSQVARMAGVAVVLLPAVLVLAGVAALLHGVAPQLALASWAALAVAAVVGLLGELLRLPGWARAISPFHHLPAVPAEGASVAAPLAVVAVAATLMAIGMLALQRRDIATP